MINLSDLSIYKGKLVSFNIGMASMSFEKQFLNDTSLTPKTTQISKRKFIPLSVVIEINASNRNEFELLKGKLINDMTECDITWDDLPEKTYEAYINGDPTVTKDLPEIGDISFNMLAICNGNQKVREFTSTTTFTYEGQSETPAVLEVTTSVALTSLTVTGLTKASITIKNIARNVPLIIDGEKALITQNGANKFSDSDLWSFPSIKVGSNTVTVNSTSCNCTLRYKPRFI